MIDIIIIVLLIFIAPFIGRYIIGIFTSFSFSIKESVSKSNEYGLWYIYLGITIVILVIAILFRYDLISDFWN